MKKRSIALALTLALVLTPALAAEGEVMDRFDFHSQYAAAYAQEHPEEYAAFDADECYDLVIYRSVFLPKEVWMANRGLDEDGFKAAMWEQHLYTMADEAYDAYMAESFFPTTRTYPGFADVTPGIWYESAVRTCYEIGLMNGTDKGFEPDNTLTVAECAAVAARIREAVTGRAISAPVSPWYQTYVDYMRAADPALDPILAHPEEPISRMQYLLLLNAALPADKGLLSAINDITVLPDTDNSVVLTFYNAGILTGVDKQGTFAGERTLMRQECAAMVARIARTELRQSFVPEATPTPSLTDLSLTAAYLTPGTVMFEGGITAEQFLTAVNGCITQWETALGADFNWHADAGDGKTVLIHVKEDSLSALGVTPQQGTQAYTDFDHQVYYSRLIDLLGGPLG